MTILSGFASPVACTHPRYPVPLGRKYVAVHADHITGLRWHAAQRPGTSVISTHHRPLTQVKGTPGRFIVSRPGNTVVDSGEGRAPPASGRCSPGHSASHGRQSAKRRGKRPLRSCAKLQGKYMTGVWFIGSRRCASNARSERPPPGKHRIFAMAADGEASRLRGSLALWPPCDNACRRKRRRWRPVVLQRPANPTRQDSRCTSSPGRPGPCSLAP